MTLFNIPSLTMLYAFSRTN